ncbi:MAG: SusD/RagB family nutrient-binding outer membrane lipoprotein [Chitinophagaceae bacterium]|nr:SusD/RagB family nutrient-binding outer membrane lipoprotein [Chitinophagaceae bacterium]
MKNKSFKTLASVSLFALAVVGTGCAKISEFGDINQNPNGITNPIPSALLTNVLSQLGGFGTSTRTTTYAQYVSENQYTDVSLYSLPQLEMGGNYSGPLQDCQTIIDFNIANPGTAAAYGSNNNQIGIARILKAFIHWYNTDRWGDVPYSEALKGAGNFTPKYDLQEDIYFDMMKELKEAAAGFDIGAPIKGDIIYNGNTDKWKKVANSMRLMMAMRLTKVYPAAGGKAAVAFAEAANAPGGLITSNADNFTLNFPGGAFKNPWFATYEARDDYAESKTLGDVLNGLGDTRQSVYGTNAVTFPYGLTRDLAVSFSNSVGNGQSRVLAASKRADNSPTFIIPAATVLLTRAEGYERGWIPGGTAAAEADYNAAIAASFDQWGVAMPGGYLSGPANYNTGGGVPGNIGAGTAPYDQFRAADNNVQDAATTSKLARIALQRWVAAYPNGNEGWAEWRRTGVPNLKGTRFATNAGKQIVRRYVYGVNDYSLNNAQTKAAAARITGGDTQDGRVWWDKP